jgi:hypothetical protein
MKISIGKMLRVALFSLPLALPAFAQSAGSDTGTPPSGTERAPMGQQPAPSDTGQQNPNEPSRGGSMEMNKEANQPSDTESNKNKSETGKKKHHTSDTGSQNY